MSSVKVTLDCPGQVSLKAFGLSVPWSRAVSGMHVAAIGGAKPVASSVTQTLLKHQSRICGLLRQCSDNSSRACQCYGRLDRNTVNLPV